MTATDPSLKHDGRCLSWRYDDPEVCTCRDPQGWTPDGWANGKLLPFDLETTGPDPLTARIVTATTIDIIPWPRRSTHVRNWLSDVDGEPIPDEAAAIHGITTEHARANGRPHREVVAEVRGVLEFAMQYGKPICGHNVSYDLTVVAAECERLGMPPFRVTGYVIDSITLDRAVDRYRRGSRKLIDTARHYGVALSEEDAHGSAADALAAARIAWHIAQRHSHVGRMSLDELMKFQRDAHRRWADNFGAYLTRQGKADDVSRDWPMRGTA